MQALGLRTLEPQLCCNSNTMRDYHRHFKTGSSNRQQSVIQYSRLQRAQHLLLFRSVASETIHTVSEGRACARNVARPLLPPLLCYRIANLLNYSLRSFDIINTAKSGLFQLVGLCMQHVNITCYIQLMTRLEKHLQ